VLKDRLYFEDYKPVNKFVETPDFLEFANFGLISNRDELINKSKVDNLTEANSAENGFTERIQNDRALEDRSQNPIHLPQIW